MKIKGFTFKTREGSIRIFVLFLCLMLLFSLASNMLSTGFYKVERSRVVFDVRGADLSVEIWRPYNISPDMKLPAVMVSHGGSEMASCTSIYAWELARRGFVVINENMNGAATNEQPDFDEAGLGQGTYSRASTGGHLDILNYVKTITYVDPTRIGMWGHSQGGGTQASSLMHDQQYYTLNDRMLNILNEEYGIQISAEQVTENADDIAAANLTELQLGEYNQKKVEQQAIVDRYVHFARSARTDVDATVAGHEVKRDYNMNMMFSIGAHEDVGIPDPAYAERYQTSLRTTDALVNFGIYSVPDNSMDPNVQTKFIGNLWETNVQNSPELKAAIESNSARFYVIPQTIHNGWLWAHSAISPSIEVITQTLQYNNGDLSNPNTVPINTKDLSVGYATLVFTTLAFFTLIVMLAALASILVKSKFFAMAASDCAPARMPVKGKDFWIWVVATALVGFIGMWCLSQNNFGFSTSIGTMTKALPWEPAQVKAYFQVIGLSVSGILIFLLLNKVLFKKSAATEPRLATLAELNVKCGWKRFFKTLLVGVILFAAAYLSAYFIDVFFDTRFLHVDGSYEVMAPQNFGRMFRYFVLFLPFCGIISTLNNMVTIKGVSGWKDTAINIIVTTLGMILFMGIGFAVTYSTPGHEEIFRIHAMLSSIFIVPACNYMYRQMYKITGSVWAGAILVAIFLAWRCAGYLCQRFMWYGNNEIEAFWGIPVI